MFRFLVIAILAPIIVWGISNPDKCANGAPLPLAVRIGGCFPCSPCLLIPEIGFSSIEIDFIAPTILQNPYLMISIDVMGQIIGDPSGGSICNIPSVGECPLNKGDRVTIKLNEAIGDYSSSYKTLPSNITLSLEEGDTIIACSKFPALTAF